MSWIASEPGEFEGEAVGNGQCVAFVVAAADTPHTADWSRGELVKGANVPSGCAIATFDPDGTYGNHTDGRSHAAIFVAQHPDGLLVWDQWVGHPVSQRTIHFRDGQGHAVNDGDQFHVIEAA